MACGLIPYKWNNVGVDTTPVDLQMWGKWGNNGEFRYPLLAHLFDTLLAAKAVFDWLPKESRSALAKAADTDETSLRLLVLASSGLHDIGKATPVFQAQLLSQNKGQFSGHMRDLSSCKFSFDGVPMSPTPAEELFLKRHEISGSVYLAAKFGAGSPLVEVISGHHGTWKFFTEEKAYDYPAVYDYYEALKVSEWGKEADNLTREIETLLGCNLTNDLPKIKRAVVPVLTGLVVLADWIASSVDSVESGTRALGDPKTIDGDFISEREKWLQVRVTEVLGTLSVPDGDFESIFGFPPIRPVQKSLVQKRDAGLQIVMVPMGEGKTEAALGHWLINGAGRGVYFALPTMATADAMFTRVQGFFSTTNPKVFATLAHSKSILNAFYDLDPRETRPIDQGLEASSWFSGKHRALLAPVSVGTVDQVLFGVLKHKYNFLRLLGLLGKTVILDEVHSYDPYSTVLLEGFLEWAGCMGVDVVLLSATLPKSKALSYLTAYQRGQGSPKTADIDLPYPAVLRISSLGEITIDDLSTISSGREQNIKLELIPAKKNPSEDIIEKVLKLQSKFPQAKIGVIVNTVGKAQAIASVLPDALILHSRFPASLRNQITQDAILRFGKNSTPGPDLLVATQIVEQSIDLDFDVLITELAPAASLLQRIGRLWRHDLAHRERSRPSGLDKAICFITYPKEESNSPYEFMPYSPAEIFKTLGVIRNLKQVSLPLDVQTIVDSANVNFEDLVEFNDKWTESQLLADSSKKLSARDNLIPRPAELTRKVEFLENFSPRSSGEPRAADTRWFEGLSVEVLLISTAVPGLPAGPVPNNPTRSEVVGFLSSAVTLNSNLARSVLSLKPGVTETKTNNPLLSGTYTVDLDVSEGWLRLDLRSGLFGV